MTSARGERDRVLPASEVLRLARIYRRRSLNDVAHDLIERALDDRPSVEAEVESFFEQSKVEPDDVARLLEVARAVLPAELYGRVAAALAEGSDLGRELIGYQPLSDHKAT